MSLLDMQLQFERPESQGNFLEEARFATRLVLPRGKATDRRDLPIFFKVDPRGGPTSPKVRDVQVMQAAIVTATQFIPCLAEGQIPPPPSAAYTFAPLTMNYTVESADIRGRPIQLKVRAQ